MSQLQPEFASIAPGASIAFHKSPAQSDSVHQPGLFWLGGFKSSMDGTKASALAAWAEDRGLACTRFDYSGHGASSGRLEDGTISAWLGESLAMFDQHTEDPQIIIGSSMGGWLAMLLYRHLQEQGQTARVHALVLIAPAADMSEELMWQRFS